MVWDLNKRLIGCGVASLFALSGCAFTPSSMPTDSITRDNVRESFDTRRLVEPESVEQQTSFLARIDNTPIDTEYFQVTYGPESLRSELFRSALDELRTSLNTASLQSRLTTPPDRIDPKNLAEANAFEAERLRTKFEALGPYLQPLLQTLDQVDTQFAADTSLSQLPSEPFLSAVRESRLPVEQIVIPAAASETLQNISIDFAVANMTLTDLIAFLRPLLQSYEISIRGNLNSTSQINAFAPNQTAADVFDIISQQTNQEIRFYDQTVWIFGPIEYLEQREIASAARELIESFDEREQSQQITDSAVQIRQVIGFLITQRESEFEMTVQAAVDQLAQFDANLSQQMQQQASQLVNESVNYDRETAERRRQILAGYPTMDLLEPGSAAGFIRARLGSNVIVRFDPCANPGFERFTAKIYSRFAPPQDLRDRLGDMLQVLDPTGAGVETLSDSTASENTDPDGASETQDAIETELNATTNGTCEQTVKPVVVASDNTGVIVTGLKSQIDLASQFLRGIDHPGLQVLVEAYLVQVDTDWRRKLAVTLGLSTNTGNISIGGNEIGSGVIALARGLVGDASTFTVGGTGSAANTEDVKTLLQLLEQNEIGRTISSPTILAKDGITASISRTRTIRYQGPSTQTVSSTDPPVTTVTPGEIKTIEAPLELKITPAINVRNRHVTLDFSFVETLYDEAQPDELSSSLTNKIETTIETGPGEIVVLAGLYQESNSRGVLGLPGTTSNPTMAALLGGEDDQQRTQSDLLVFLAPTVLQPREDLP